MSGDCLDDVSVLTMTLKTTTKKDNNTNDNNSEDNKDKKDNNNKDKDNMNNKENKKILWQMFYEERQASQLLCGPSLTRCDEGGGRRISSGSSYPTPHVKFATKIPIN